MGEDHSSLLSHVVIAAVLTAAEDTIGLGHAFAMT